MSQFIDPYLQNLLQQRQMVDLVEAVIGVESRSNDHHKHDALVLLLARLENQLPGELKKVRYMPDFDLAIIEATCQFLQLALNESRLQVASAVKVELVLWD